MTNKETFNELRVIHYEATTAYLNLLKSVSYEDVFILAHRRELSMHRASATYASVTLTHFMMKIGNPNQDHLPDQLNK